MTGDFKKLIMGDVVRHKVSGECYVIMQVHNYGTERQTYSAIRPINMSNESEWEIVTSDELKRWRPR
jgi:hypothetical protein